MESSYRPRRNPNFSLDNPYAIPLGKFRISISPQTMSRELRAMNYRKLSVRPRHHEQAEGAIALFKSVSPPCWSKSRAIKVSTRAA